MNLFQAFATLPDYEVGPKIDKMGLQDFQNGPGKEIEARVAIKKDKATAVAGEGTVKVKEPTTIMTAATIMPTTTTAAAAITVIMATTTAATNQKKMLPVIATAIALRTHS